MHRADPTRAVFDPPLPYLVAATLVACAAVWIRLEGTAWDGFASLHPDERHMIFVLGDMRDALTAFSADGGSAYDLWFATGASGLDPRLSGRGHVYGEAPLLTVALAAWQWGLDGWGDLLLLGRRITAVLDGSVVIAVFVLAWTLARSGPAAVLAAARFGAAPTALQLANFFTVDAWLTWATAWSLVCLVSLSRAPRAMALVGGGFAGLALAAKITGALLAAPALVALVALATRQGLRPALAATLIFAAAALAALRLTSPFLFAGPGIFGIWPAQAFIDDIAELTRTAGAEGFPPNWQWQAGYSAWALLRDAALFGLGPVLTGLACLALVRRPGAALIPLSLGAAVLVWTLAGAAAPLRYLAPAMPALAALSALATARLPLWTVAGLGALAVWWGAGTVRLHAVEHPRIEASRWLWSLPKGTALANETPWDEGLPVAVFAPRGWTEAPPLPHDHFRQIMLDITAPDTPAKARALARRITRADYLILSSGRQREVMPRLPERFPMTSAYYRLLAEEAHCLTRVLRLDRGYPLPGLPFDDGWVQEPWRVYDHPIVEIYRRGACFDADAFAAELMRALEP